VQLLNIVLCKWLERIGSESSLLCKSLQLVLGVPHNLYFSERFTLVLLNLFSADCIAKVLHEFLAVDEIGRNVGWSLPRLFSFSCYELFNGVELVEIAAHHRWAIHRCLNFH
jgi:hypothetical protein